MTDCFFQMSWSSTDHIRYFSVSASFLWAASPWRTGEYVSVEWPFPLHFPFGNGSPLFFGLESHHMSFIKEHGSLTSYIPIPAWLCPSILWSNCSSFHFIYSPLLHVHVLFYKSNCSQVVILCNRLSCSLFCSFHWTAQLLSIFLSKKPWQFRIASPFCQFVTNRYWVT